MQKLREEHSPRQGRAQVWPRGARRERLRQRLGQPGAPEVPGPWRRWLRRCADPARASGHGYSARHAGHGARRTQREVGRGRGRCTRRRCLCERPHGVAVAGLCWNGSAWACSHIRGSTRSVYWVGGDLVLSGCSFLTRLKCWRSSGAPCKHDLLEFVSPVIVALTGMMSKALVVTRYPIGTQLPSCRYSLLLLQCFGFCFCPRSHPHVAQAGLRLLSCHQSLPSGVTVMNCLDLLFWVF